MVWITFRTDGTERGYIYYANPANITVYSTTSDYRLKEEITDIDEDKTVARMEKLRTRHYKWKETGAYMRGFIAHELAEDGYDYAVSFEKDAVDKDGNPQYQGIDTSLLVADICCVNKYLIRNVKELKEENKTLKTRVEVLEQNAGISNNLPTYEELQTKLSSLQQELKTLKENQGKIMNILLNNNLI